MKELYRNEKLMCLLQEDNHGALFLTVTCGGVGMYDLRIQLNAEEVQNYQNQGEGFLNNLASKIGKNSSAYLDRTK